MSDPFRPGDPDGSGGLGAIPFRAAEAAAAIEALKAPAERAARAVDDAFAAAGESLARSLARAAADGEVSLAELARAVIAAVEAAARARGAGGGLAEALGAAVAGAFSGARADGGPVASGGAYLVGERGPELFRPAVSGTLETTTPAALAVTVTVRGDGREGLLRSEAQLAQAVWRAASLGGRRGW